MLGKESLGEKLTCKQSPEGNEGVTDVALWGGWGAERRMYKAVETASAKALRQECVGDRGQQGGLWGWSRMSKEWTGG